MPARYNCQYVCTLDKHFLPRSRIEHMVRMLDAAGIVFEADAMCEQHIHNIFYAARKRNLLFSLEIYCCR